MSLIEHSSICNIFRKTLFLFVFSFTRTRSIERGWWGAGEAGEKNARSKWRLCLETKTEKRQSWPFRWARPDPGSRPGWVWQRQEEGEFFLFEIIFEFQLIFLFVFVFIWSRWAAGAGALAGTYCLARLRSGEKLQGGRKVHLGLDFTHFVWEFFQGIICCLKLEYNFRQVCFCTFCCQGGWWA